MTKTVIVCCLALLACLGFLVRSRPPLTFPLVASSGQAAGSFFTQKRVFRRPADFPPENSSDGLRQKMQGWLESRDPVDKDKLLAGLAEWVRVDPTAAFQFIDSLEPGMLKEELGHRAVQWWCAQDPVAAKAWAVGLTDEGKRKSAVGDICIQIAATDAREATQLAEQQGLANQPGTILPELVLQWAGQDFSGASSWVNQHPAGEQRDELVARLAMVQSKTAPAEAARLVVQEIPAGPIQTEAAISVLNKWALTDMAGAQSWVDQFPDGPIKERAEAELSGMIACQNSLPKN